MEYAKGLSYLEEISISRWTGCSKGIMGCVYKSRRQSYFASSKKQSKSYKKQENNSNVGIMCCAFISEGAGYMKQQDHNACME